MLLLKEVVHRTTLPTDGARAFASLCPKLAELDVPIEEEDRVRGEIVVRCLTTAINTIFWRCWSDKLFFEVKEIDETKTQINVYVIPNLLRFKVGQSEKIFELKESVSRLLI